MLELKTITVGARRATSAASCRAPDGSRGGSSSPVISPIAWAARSTSRSSNGGGGAGGPFVERDRVDLPDPLPAHLDALFCGDPVGGGLHVGEHVRELLG